MKRYYYVALQDYYNKDFALIGSVVAEVGDIPDLKPLTDFATMALVKKVCSSFRIECSIHSPEKADTERAFMFRVGSALYNSTELR